MHAFNMLSDTPCRHNWRLQQDADECCFSWQMFKGKEWSCNKALLYRSQRYGQLRQVCSAQIAREELGAHLTSTGLYSGEWRLPSSTRACPWRMSEAATASLISMRSRMPVCGLPARSAVASAARTSVVAEMLYPSA